MMAETYHTFEEFQQACFPNDMAERRREERARALGITLYELGELEIWEEYVRRMSKRFGEILNDAITEAVESGQARQTRGGG